MRILSGCLAPAGTGLAEGPDRRCRDRIAPVRPATPTPVGFASNRPYQIAVRLLFVSVRLPAGERRETLQMKTSDTRVVQGAPIQPAGPPSRGGGGGGWGHRIRRAAPGLALVASSLGGLAVWLPAPPAAAQSYGPQAQCVMSVNPTSLYAGQSFTVMVTVGPGSLPAETTAPVMISGSTVPLATIAVPTTGSVSATVTVPPSLGPGLHTVTVQACSATLAGSLYVIPSTAPASSTVTPSAAPSAAPSAGSSVIPQATVATPVTAASSGLAFTGADVVVTVAAGAVAIGAGGAFVLIGRRRRSRA